MHLIEVKRKSVFLPFFNSGHLCNKKTCSDKNYEIEVCGRPLTHSVSLKKHMNIHSGKV